ncbi:TRAP transporter fused permease subunit [Nordella sp. HKS 07]|uniref:TRAP transporter permease n=1 Tax=Nordella sp. HKS 07 TaxID=2712222 RepID=UPI0013E16BBB|nr:TRAP transporter fused permease subunit [Nordella sp. HKS 07]QIG51862.1 TRAP transporter fused permease subunit [Nordella sp. HKS 07]
MPEADVDQDKLDQLALDSESGRTRRLSGWQSWLAAGLCAGLSLYALYWTQFAINTSIYRATFVGIVLAAAFLIYPLFPKGEGRHIRIVDWLLIALTFASITYLVTHLEATKMRATSPLEIEVWLGGILMLLVLEATRRATGWALPLIAIGFLVYAYFGRYMPEPFNHRGFSISRIVGQNYLTLEGLFSTPTDVAATFIIIFSLYGAVLDRGGAGRFFIDWAFALFGKKPAPAAPGRAVVASGFLLGTVSGSGVATTVTLASLSWPMLKRSGYNPATAGGLTAAAGIGATLSPPTLGAAAFIIAEYLDISYLDVLVMATIPTVLYYLCCWLMVEADARRLNVKPVKTSDQSLWRLTSSQGYHFLSLAAIAVLLIYGLSAFMAVFWSIVVAVILSLIRSEQRLLTMPGAAAAAVLALFLYLAGMRLSVAAFLGLIAGGIVSIALYYWEKRQGRAPDAATERLIAALVEGGKGCVGIAATCATAGIIVSIINLTGLGLKLSGQIVELGGGSLAVTILLAAFAMWILGTAIPVTASYIIAAVILVPGLVSLDVPAPAAHMFMFYYAVLADVSPPTALAPFAASAICGGSPFRTMMQAWKYTLPAFVVPVMFCLSPDGMGLLLSGSVTQIVMITLTSALALAGFSIGAAGWISGPAHVMERLGAVAGGIALMVPDTRWQIAGAILVAAVASVHIWRYRRLAPA